MGNIASNTNSTTSPREVGGGERNRRQPPNSRITSIPVERDPPSNVRILTPGNSSPFIYKYIYIYI